MYLLVIYLTGSVLKFRDRLDRDVVVVCMEVFKVLFLEEVSFIDFCYDILISSLFYYKILVLWVL